MKIEPGVLCIVIRSKCGNEGREVVAVRRVFRYEPLPEFGPGWASECDGWMVEAREPLRSVPDDPNPRLAACPDSWLLPLAPPPGTTTEHTDTPLREVA